MMLKFNLSYLCFLSLLNQSIIYAILSLVFSCLLPFFYLGFLFRSVYMFLLSELVEAESCQG